MNYTNEQYLNELNYNAEAIGKSVNLTPFGVNFTKMLNSRISNPVALTQLHELKAYQEAQAAYDALHMDVFDKDISADKKTVQEIICALYRLRDLETQYIYRMGFRDGIAVTRTEFLTEGIM